ncbi:hypothetical protein [Actinacidiphila glaucinigra]|uniref:hypothetical protein n=1 Tax=Actinacidiphila glaucinigra TaxID=235986 RepID=UPI0015C5E9B3|nr:hypothetical protein [Actinacidiphila glaucinigra]
MRVEPFLIARHPLTVAQVRHWLPEYEDDFADSPSATTRLGDDVDDLLEAYGPAAHTLRSGLPRRSRRDVGRPRSLEPTWWRTVAAGRPATADGMLRATAVESAFNLPRPRAL